MKSEFVQPRFDGDRFAEHTLPLEVARDLAAYETLVVELAKHLYLKDHPERQRVPKGFAADFHLHLERVDAGCAEAGALAGDRGSLGVGGGNGRVFRTGSRAYRAVHRFFRRAVAGGFPAGVARSISIRSAGPLIVGERMELPAENGQTAVLTPERRKALVLAADTVYERPIELAGTIIEAHWEKASFQLRPKVGQPIVVPMPDSFHAQASAYGGRSRHQVVVKGVGAYDSWENLVKVVSADSLEVQPDYQLANRFDELRGLEDGWYEGSGKAPDRRNLDRVAARMIGHYPEKLSLPAIVPTPEGNLLLEWSAPGDPSLDIDLASLQGEFHVFQSPSGDLETRFDLSMAEEWPKLFALLAQFAARVAS